MAWRYHAFTPFMDLNPIDKLKELVASLKAKGLV